jgi:hypothetical protein
VGQGEMRGRICRKWACRASDERSLGVCEMHGPFTGTTSKKRTAPRGQERSVQGNQTALANVPGR